MAKTTRNPAGPITDDPQCHAEADPRYAAALEKFNELRIRLANVNRRVDSEQARLNAESTRGRQMAEAESLVYEHEAPREVLGKSLRELMDERQVLVLAVDLAERRLQHVQSDVSREICHKVKPHYRELVRGLHGALRALAEARAAEARFCGALIGGGTELATLGRVTLGFDLDWFVGEFEEQAQLGGLELARVAPVPQ